MTGDRSHAPAAPSRGTWIRALAVWCAFTVYGSFIPFHIDVLPAPAKLAALAWLPLEHGVRNFSRLDVAANVLLFVPFGFLLLGLVSPGPRPLRPFRIALIGLAALVFGAALETAQLFTPDRVASAIDVQANVAGALLGAALASLLLARADRDGSAMLDTVRREPALLGVAILAAYVAGQSLYPFAVTLDMSTLVDNVRSARWDPLSLPSRGWSDLVVDRVVVFGLLAMLLGASARALLGRRATGRVIACATTFAAALELGKLFVVGRAPTTANVLLALPGIVPGALLAARRSACVSTPLLLGLALVFLGHAELSPFSFDLSSAHLAHQIARIEWEPLRAYFHAPPQDALFDLWNKVLRAGFLGFALARAGAGARLVAAGGLAAGLAFESLQLVTIDRVASVTDVLVFGASAWLGRRVHAALADERSEPAGELAYSSTK